MFNKVNLFPSIEKQKVLHTINFSNELANMKPVSCISKLKLSKVYFFEVVIKIKSIYQYVTLEYMWLF